MSWWGGAPHRRRVLAVSVVIVVAVAWWWWPTLRADPERLDVLIVADGQLREAADPVARRVRELGLSVRESVAPGSWCDAVNLVAAERAERSPRRIVVSVRAADPSCTGFDGLDGEGWERLRDVAGDAGLVLVVQPGPAPLGQPSGVLGALRQGEGWVLADPSVLLGELGEERMPCQWWDDCEADGAVAVRDETGSLTAAGGERVARVLAAVLP